MPGSGPGGRWFKSIRPDQFHSFLSSTYTFTLQVCATELAAQEARFGLLPTCAELTPERSSRLRSSVIRKLQALVARCSCQQIDSLEDRFYRNNCGRGGRVRTNWCLPRSAPSKFFCVGFIWLEYMMSVAQHSVALFLREEMLRIFVCGCSSKRS
jgi:hypothetical protein